MATKKKKEKESVPEDMKKGIINFSPGCILEISLEGVNVSITMMKDGKQLQGICTLKEE